MKTHQLLISLAILFPLLFTARAIPEENPAKAQLTSFSRPNSPFLLLTPTEISELKTRIAKDPEAKQVWTSLLAKVDGYLAKPLRFPSKEGGWGHKFICPDCDITLTFNPESPYQHLCPRCHNKCEGLALDQAWNTMAMREVAARLEEIAVVALLREEPRYTAELKTAWLDIAEKYPNFRLHEKDMRFGDDVLPSAGLATSQSIDESNLISKLAFSWDALLGTGTLTSKELNFIQKNFWGVAATYFHRVLDLHGSGGNWRVWYDCGALLTGCFSDDIPLMNQALNAPEYGINSILSSGYINSEGLVEERSATYQSFAMMAMSRMALFSKRAGLTFHQNPRVMKAFTAFFDLRLPDLSLPCMNDGGRTSFKKSASSGPQKDSSLLEVLNIGWKIYQSPKIKDILCDLQNSPEAPERRKRLYALIYGPTDLQPTRSAVLPVFWPESGIALLRSPEKDWCLLLKNNPNPNGHAHPNALQIGMFANGEEVIPLFGTPPYGSKYYKSWFATTLAHNTLVVNLVNQPVKSIKNSLDWGIVKGSVQAAHGITLNFQQPDLIPAVPLRMTRTILLTPLAMYEILRVTEEQPPIKTEKAHQTNKLNSVLHFNGALSWQARLVTASMPWQVPDVEELKAQFENNSRAQTESAAKANMNFNDPYAPFRWLKEASKLNLREGDVVRAELVQPAGGRVALALFPPSTGETLHQVLGPGYENEPAKFLPMAVRHLTANNARFGSVAVPFKGANPLGAVKIWVDTPVATLFSVETTEGHETVCQSDSPNPLKSSQAGLTFSGSLGVIRQSKNAAKQYTLLGASLSDASGILSTDKPVPVQMTLETDGPLFVNLGEEPVHITWTPAGKAAPISKSIQPTKKD